MPNPHDDLLIAALLMEDDDDDGNDLDDDFGAFLGGLAHAHLLRIEDRNLRRVYLLRGDLHPNPRQDSPWLRLYDAGNDRAFITTMGIDVSTFELLLSSGFEEQWDSNPILRPDVPLGAQPRPEKRSLDAAGALGLVLHWLNSTMREISLQQIFALVPTTVTRYIHAALPALLSTLQSMYEARICWPTPQECEEFSAVIQQRHGLLAGAFGVVDGLKLPLQTSGDDDVENATYNGWLHAHFISNVLAFAPDGTVIHAKLNCPGSWHDSRVARGLYDKLSERTPNGYYLIADTAFPRTAASIQERIRAPVQSNYRPSGSRTAREAAQRLNDQVLSYRQSAEWGMRDVQGSFGRLRLPLPVDDNRFRFEIVETCIRLHQIRVRRVGVSHIKNVYQSIWTEDDGLLNVWMDWERMLFREMWKADRVSRFHHIREED